MRDVSGSEREQSRPIMDVYVGIWYNLCYVFGFSSRLGVSLGGLQVFLSQPAEKIKQMRADQDDDK